jgi:hypothetical protein
LPCRWTRSFSSATRVFAESAVLLLIPSAMR